MTELVKILLQKLPPADRREATKILHTPDFSRRFEARLLREKGGSRLRDGLHRGGDFLTPNHTVDTLALAILGDAQLLDTPSHISHRGINAINISLVDTLFETGGLALPSAREEE